MSYAAAVLATPARISRSSTPPMETNAWTLPAPRAAMNLYRSCCRTDRGNPEEVRSAALILVPRPAHHDVDLARCSERIPPMGHQHVIQKQNVPPLPRDGDGRIVVSLLDFV